MISHNVKEVLKPNNMRPHTAMWQAAADGRPDWDRLFEGYVAAVDQPASAFWKVKKRNFFFFFVRNQLIVLFVGTDGKVSQLKGEQEELFSLIHCCFFMLTRSLLDHSHSATLWRLVRERAVHHMAIITRSTKFFSFILHITTAFSVLFLLQCFRIMGSWASYLLGVHLDAWWIASCGSILIISMASSSSKKRRGVFMKRTQKKCSERCRLRDCSYLTWSRGGVRLELWLVVINVNVVCLFVFAEPLCKFLNKPVPSEPFPRVNDKDAFRRRLLGMKIFGTFFFC